MMEAVQKREAAAAEAQKEVQGQAAAIARQQQVLDQLQQELEQDAADLQENGIEDERAALIRERVEVERQQGAAKVKDTLLQAMIDTTNASMVEVGERQRDLQQQEAALAVREEVMAAREAAAAAAAAALAEKEAAAALAAADEAGARQHQEQQSEQGELEGATASLLDELLDVEPQGDAAQVRVVGGACAYCQVCVLQRSNMKRCSSTTTTPAVSCSVRPSHSTHILHPHSARLIPTHFHNNNHQGLRAVDVATQLLKGGDTPSAANNVSGTAAAAGIDLSFGDEGVDGEEEEMEGEGEQGGGDDDALDGAPMHSRRDDGDDDDVAAEDDGDSDEHGSAGLLAGEQDLVLEDGSQQQPQRPYRGKRAGGKNRPSRRRRQAAYMSNAQPPPVQAQPPCVQAQQQGHQLLLAHQQQWQVQQCWQLQQHQHQHQRPVRFIPAPMLFPPPNPLHQTGGAATTSVRSEGG